MYLLTELVRLLEQRGYIFPSDPQAITDTLRQTDEAAMSKLHRRASMMDHRHELRDRLAQHRRRVQALLWAATVLWFVVGFFAAYGLMQSSSLNFFFLLLGALGVNTVMLLFWLFTLFYPPAPKNLPLSVFYPRQNDIIGQTMLQLYAEHAMHANARWQRSKISHRLALAGLSGLFCATLLLLTVRQYSFNWQSTLLADATFVAMIRALAWLPEQLGFAVPQADAIIQGRNMHDIANAAQWGGLLLGSLLCYGLLPRAIAWFISHWQTRRHAVQLDLNFPYYQHLLQQWQRKIVDDADDYQADPIALAPPIKLSETGAHWAILLDTPHHDSTWYERQLGQHWLNQGVLANRDQVAQLIEQLQQHAVQLLIGVRAQHVPDRGTLRVLTRLSQAAQNGVIIQLLLPEQGFQHQDEVVQQWRDVLQQHGWTWLEPQP